MSKKIRSALSGLLTIVVFLGLSIGYAAEPTFDEWLESVKTEYAGESLTFVMAVHPTTSAMTSMLADFERDTGIKVNTEEVQENHLHDKLLLDFVSGGGNYDVFYLDTCWVGEFARKRVTQDLTSYINREGQYDWYDYDDFVTAWSKGSGMIDNRVHGVPINGEVTLIVYRKDILDKYGITEDDLDTTDKFLEQVKFLEGKEPDVYPVVFRSRRGHNAVYSYFQFLYPFGGTLFNPGEWEPQLTTAEAVEALKFMCELKKYAPPGMENFGVEEANTTFRSGKAVFWVGANPAIPGYSNPEVSPVIAGKIDVLQIPQGPGGNYSGWTAWNLGVSSRSRKKDLAWVFLQYMTSKEKGYDYITSGGSPVRISQFENLELVEKNWHFPEMLKSLEQAANLANTGVDWRPRIPEWTKISEELGYYVAMAFIGEMTPEQALENANNAIREIMEDAGYY